jgi:hypothetical protein
MQYSKSLLICWLSGLIIGICFLTESYGDTIPVWRKNYNAEHIAATETAMWRAYYDKNRIAGKLKLGMLLIELLQKQFGLDSQEATQTGFMLANSAMRFKKGEYAAALPPLKAAYTKIKQYTNLNFDPEKVAKADLKWWIDRRNPKRKGPKFIGQGIARLYELLYGYRHPGFTRAGMLRAQAMQLRDIGKAKANWTQIKKLLLQSYQALQYGFEKRQLTR